MVVDFNRKSLLGLAGAIFLGALGSGLWDVAVKPGAQWILRLTLSTVTLGSQTIRNQVYQHAAKGPHEAASSFVMIVVATLLLATPFWMALRIYEERRFYRRTRLSDKEGEKGTLLQMEARLTKLFLTAYILFGITLVPTTGIFIQMLQIQEATKAYTFFSQSMTICRPYIDEQHYQLLLSQYAMIRTKDDYVRITDKLRGIASANHLTLPPYTPW